ncbi:hypothetical protein [Microvirga makkahensis]|uniref:Uncharacterized protein n=1 Tax=Microvirga makkahensis TaxID=1128670 RepID=A0A7X3MU34_9HYPH|nr:hypothetical protein [Microvirga makkahensis]MXQ13224.1 hypothetical protein [Microvirga makkahensis]
MSEQNQFPRTDDFRIERDGDTIVLTFTPDGRSYTFTVDGDRLSEPTVSPPQTNAADHVEWAGDWTPCS